MRRLIKEHLRINATDFRNNPCFMQLYCNINLGPQNPISSSSNLTPPPPSPAPFPPLPVPPPPLPALPPPSPTLRPRSSLGNLSDHPPSNMPFEDRADVNHESIP